VERTKEGAGVKRHLAMTRRDAMLSKTLRIRVLTVVDQFARECLTLFADNALSQTHKSDALGLRFF